MRTDYGELLLPQQNNAWRARRDGSCSSLAGAKGAMGSVGGVEKPGAHFPKGLAAGSSSLPFHPQVLRVEKRGAPDDDDSCWIAFAEVFDGEPRPHAGVLGR